MDAEPLRWVMVFTLGLALVLALRRPVRAVFGARLAYALWWLVPGVLLARLLPAPEAGGWSGVLPEAALPVIAVAAVPQAWDGAWLSWLGALWAVGAALAVLMLWRQQRRFERRLGRLRPLGDGSWLSEQPEAGPALVGLWRPKLVLPADFAARFSAAERALVLAHEAVHRRRGDHALNAFAALLRALFWFHPLAHLAIGRFRIDQELACDAAVMAAHPGTGRVYAEAMLKTQLTDPGLPVGCHWQSGHALKERILMLKRVQPSRVRRGIGSLLMAGLVMGAGTTVWAAQEPAASTDAAAEGRDVSYAAMSAPAYPEGAVAAGQHGTVLLRVLVEADGRAGTVEVARSSGHPALDRAAAAQVPQWRFNPSLRDGKAVAQWVHVPVTFALDADEQGSASTDGPVLDALNVRASTGD